MHGLKLFAEHDLSRRPLPPLRDQQHDGAACCHTPLRLEFLIGFRKIGGEASAAPQSGEAKILQGPKQADARPLF